jgi:lipopolysaccharide export system permease protein
MRLLDRYLLRELLVPLSYCLGAFLMFWIAFDLFTELENLQEYKMRAGDVAIYYLVRTPEFLVMVLPISLLLALLYTLTNHARHHEIVAMRAAGVSLWRLAVPYLGVGSLPA